MGSSSTLNDETKNLIREFYDEKFAPFSDYDAIAQISFAKLDDFVSYRNDPYFLAIIMPDHVNFAEIGKTTMTVGRKNFIVRDGKSLVHNIYKDKK